MFVELSIICSLPLLFLQPLCFWRAAGSILQRSDSQTLPAHVHAERPRQNSTIYCTFGTWKTKPIKSAHIFQGTIHCQIKDKYNPTYCLVLQLGMDPWCSATVKTLVNRFPNRGMETRPRVSRLHICNCFTWAEVFICRAWLQTGLPLVP